VKFAFIKQHRTEFPIRIQCEVFDVSRSGYYAWLGRTPSQRSRMNGVLLKAIRRIHQSSRQHYGLKKAWKQLQREGIECSRNRVARLRATHDVYAKRRRRFVVTTRSKHNYQSTGNLLQREFTQTAENQVWVSDVTFVPTRRGWLYLAVTIDLYSRKVIGWSMSDKNNGQLTLDCLNMALTHRQPKPGLMHHSDRGSTYVTQAFRDMCTKHGIVQSMSRKGDCWDNAVAESFFSNLKNELTYWHKFKDRDEARKAIFDYIEVFYNRQRLHQTLGYQTPVEFEAKAA